VSSYLLLVLLAMVLVLALTPVVRRFALRLEIVDVPGGRKDHQAVTPLLGGLALLVGFVLALALAGGAFYLRQLGAILAGAVLMSLLGLWDDRRPLPALVKLAFQVAIAVLLLPMGVAVSFLPWKEANYLVTVLWIVSVTNALNLCDNMDGLSSGLAVVASGFYLLMAAANGQYLVGAMSAALLGASVGFLYYNFSSSRKIFLGDAGSLVLGYLLAVAGIKLRFPHNLDIVTWMVPVMVLAVPLFDMALVTVSRLRRGISPFTPGRDHLSHRLVALGWTKREAVMALYLAAVLSGFLGAFVSQGGVFEAYLSMMGMGTAAVVLVTYFLRMEAGKDGRSQ
jgi:UDP-GlcNAc:undecaprenyl-phosphate GlcNAc-1-phosphate transferase